MTLLDPENYSQIKSVIDFPADVSLVTPNSNTAPDQVWDCCCLCVLLLVYCAYRLGGVQQQLYCS